MVTSVRAQSLILYRDILRATRHFTWTDKNGEKWSRVLQKNARREFEQASYERDPEILARLLVVGREALDKSMEKMSDKAKVIDEKSRNP